MSRREIAGWCLYDFAKSSYEATIQVVVFATYFTAAVVPPEGVDLGFLHHVGGEAIWGWTVGLTMVPVALFAPWLGAIADYSGSKKRFFFVFTYVGCLATAFMYFVKPGDWALAILLLFASNFALSAANGFYNAFLPEIAPADQAGRVSGWAWGVGYIGSALSLLLALAMIKCPECLERFGLSKEHAGPIRAVLLSVGIWWAVFSIPTFLWVRQRPPAPLASGGCKPPGNVPESQTSIQGLRPPARGDAHPHAMAIGFHRVIDTLRHIRQHREAAKFLLAYLIFNDGVETVIAVSAIFATRALAMSSEEVILIFLAIQIVGIPGTLLMGHLADRCGHKRAVVGSLAVWMAVVAGVYFVQTQWQFWVMSLTLGFWMGPVQAASRSLFSRLIPAERATEFFGFYSLSGKFSSILGPIVFGLVAYATGSVRAAVFGILPFFVVGMALLAFVREPGAETTHTAP